MQSPLPLADSEPLAFFFPLAVSAALRFALRCLCIGGWKLPPPSFADSDNKETAEVSESTNQLLVDTLILSDNE